MPLGCGRRKPKTVDGDIANYANTSAKNMEVLYHENQAALAARAVRDSIAGGGESLRKMSVLEGGWLPPERTPSSKNFDALLGEDARTLSVAERVLAAADASPASSPASAAAASGAAADSPPGVGAGVGGALGAGQHHRRGSSGGRSGAAQRFTAAGRPEEEEDAAPDGTPARHVRR